VASIVAVLAVGGTIVWGVLTALDRPIDTVALSGQFERVTPIQVEAALGDLTGVGFLSADLERLREQVEELPWVDEPRVQRQWPAQIICSCPRCATSMRSCRLSPVPQAARDWSLAVTSICAVRSWRRDDC
jgi:hypothetical protein